MLTRTLASLLALTIVFTALPAFAEEAEPTSVVDAPTPDLPPPPPPRAMAPKLATSPLPAPLLERRSPAAMIGGIILTSAGGLAVLYVGATAMAACDDDADCEAQANVNRATVLGGAIALAVGIPLIIYGAKHVAGNEAGRTAPLPRWAGAPSAMGWGWTL